MKNSNLLKVVIATGTIMTLSIFGASASAMGNGSGNGEGRGFGKTLTEEQRIELKAMSQEERESYKSNFSSEKGHGEDKQKGKGKNNKKDKEGKDNHNTSDMLKDIPMQSLSAIEIDLLEKQYEEEMMANELYNSFYEMHGIETFKNIAESEAKHMEAVKALLDRYDIDTPTNYDHIQDLYDSLKESGSKSAFDALEVGVKIEFVDIDDIVIAIKSTDNNDIKVVLTNIGGGSYNHLRGFLKAIDNNGYETELDWTPYLEEADLGTKGPIKYKLAEKLESEGVNLPEQVSSDSMKNEKCDNKNNGNKLKGNGEGKAKKQEITSYKASINKQYGATINALSDEKLNSIVEKIDTLSDKIKNSSEYSKSSKSKYNLILTSLKEIILERLER